MSACLWLEHSTSFSLGAPSSSLYLINAELQLPAPDGSGVVSPLSNFYGKMSLILNQLFECHASWVLMWALDRRQSQDLHTI